MPYNNVTTSYSHMPAMRYLAYLCCYLLQQQICLCLYCLLVCGRRRDLATWVSPLACTSGSDLSTAHGRTTPFLRACERAWLPDTNVIGLVSLFIANAASVNVARLWMGLWQLYVYIFFKSLYFLSGTYRGQLFISVDGTILELFKVKSDLSVLLWCIINKS